MRLTMRAGLGALLAAVVAGCGNWVGTVPPPAGITGVRLTTDGTVEIVSYVCAPDVDTLTVVTDRTGLDEDEENPVAAEWTHDTALEGLVTFDPRRPGAGWSPERGAVLDDAAGYLITLSNDDEETTDLWLEPGWRDELEPDVIVVDTGRSPDRSTLRPVATDELEDLARRYCAQDG
jgi:hypothetical protein